MMGSPTLENGIMVEHTGMGCLKMLMALMKGISKTMSGKEKAKLCTQQEPGTKVSSKTASDTDTENP